MQLSEEQLLESFSFYLDENYHLDQLSEGNAIWVFENEYMPALFEAYVEENYFVDQLTEENLQWIYEEEFLDLIGQKEVEQVSPVSIYADFLSLQEKKSGHMRSKKKVDWDKDGDNDGMDALINKFVQYGMSREDAIKKARKTMGGKGKKINEGLKIVEIGSKEDKLDKIKNDIKDSIKRKRKEEDKMPVNYGREEPFIGV